MTTNNQTPCVIFGASGYAGVELAKLVQTHPALSLQALFVSSASADAGKSLSALYPQLANLIDLKLQAGTQQNIADVFDGLSEQQSLVFLATPHEFSHDIAPSLANENTTVLDLSGGFRLQQPSLYPKHYGFEHKYSELLDSIPYALPEYQSQSLQQHKLISLPGCYPTASQLAIKPLVDAELLTEECVPVINAISGVSGAGRKASLATSFCELSLKPYNLFTHRHRPEIEQGVGRKVIFSPHVAAFERGIVATITLQVKTGTTEADIAEVFNRKYQTQPLVRIKSEIPAIKDVAYTPFCDIYWQLDGQDLIVVSAIDNVLKGASSQAIQCANMVVGLPQETMGCFITKIL